jgi:hypothetical protein
MKNTMKKRILCCGMAFLMVFAMTGFVFAGEAGSDPEGAPGAPVVAEEMADASAEQDLQKSGETTASGETAGENIDEAIIPLADYEPEEAIGQWALVNLIASLGTLLASVLLLVMVPVNELETDDRTRMINRIPLRGASVIIGIIAPVIFFLTEDLAGIMVMTDALTPVMLIILMAQMAVMVTARHRIEELDAVE